MILKHHSTAKKVYMNNIGGNNSLAKNSEDSRDPRHFRTYKISNFKTLNFKISYFRYLTSEYRVSLINSKVS